MKPVPAAVVDDSELSKDLCVVLVTIETTLFETEFATLAIEPSVKFRELPFEDEV